MTTHTAITDYYAGATLDNGSLLCHRTTDATVYTASATSELNSGGGVYSAVFANVAAGSYRLKLKSGGEVVATRDVTFAGTNGETVQTGVRAELDSGARVKLAAEQPDCSVLRTGVEYQHTQNSAGDDTVNVTIEEA